jgi:hypothetical protein
MALEGDRPMSVAAEIFESPGAPAPDRIVSADVRFPRGVPDGVISIDGPNGQVVFCCPVKGVALTERMAEAAGITTEALENLVWERCPLGIDPESWKIAEEAFLALPLIDDGLPHVTDEPFRVAIGGSSVAVFSSFETAHSKKQFPQSETQLEYLIRHRAEHHELPAEQVEELIDDARMVYRSLYIERAPLSPWFGIMNRLHLECPADVDLQFHSPVIDRVMRERASGDLSILQRMHADRLHRWDPADVYSAFPELVVLRVRLFNLGANIDIEFLGPDGNARLDARPDWWHLDTSELA